MRNHGAGGAWRADFIRRWFELSKTSRGPGQGREERGLDISARLQPPLLDLGDVKAQCHLPFVRAPLAAAGLVK